MSTEQTRSDPVAAVRDPAGQDETDAVAEAARWLADRGVLVPDVESDRAVSGPRPGVGGGSNNRRSGASAASQLKPAADAGSDDPETKARGLVLRKLTGQARTRHELDRAMKAKDIPETVAGQVLDRMEEIGLVDDAAFARDWVESRQQRRQLSRRALRHELKHKGVERDDIEAALAGVDGDDEYEAARALAERKARGMAGLTREVRTRRIAGALARRGFGSGLTSRVIAEVLADGD